jgi:hypothetical protein
MGLHGLLQGKLYLAVLYGSECWTLIKAHEALLGASERKILRKIFGAV